MDSKHRRKILALVLVAGGVWAFVRRRSVALVVLSMVYCNAREWLGIVPLKLYELVELVTSNLESAIATAGLVFAALSIVSFRLSKRLDLELAAGAAVAGVIRKTTDILSRNRNFCVQIYELRHELSFFHPGCIMPPEEARERMNGIEARWEVMCRAVNQLQQDQSDVWAISSEIIDIERVHGIAIRARVLPPYAMHRAQRLSLEVAEALSFHLPVHGDTAGAYLDSLDSYGGTSIEEFLAAEERQGTRLLEWLGAASSIGSSSVALPSAITAFRTAREIWRM